MRLEMKDAIAPLLEAWGRLDYAAQRVETALPMQMTEAVARLERERLAFRGQLQSLIRAMFPPTR